MSDSRLSQEQVQASQELVERVFRSFRDDLLKVTGSVSFSRKSDFSVVTEWDVAIEEQLKVELQAAFPGVVVAGEETGTDAAGDAYWLIDPIDGTSSFIRGLDYCTNMAAYIEDGEVKSAVIYDFIRDDMYTAQLGQGAYKNGQRITINSDRRDNELLLYSFSRKTFSQLREAFIELKSRLILPMGGAGHAYSLLAQGKIDGVVSVGTEMALYDVAPGALLASEAGAVILGYDREPRSISREFIVATPYLAEKIEQSGLI